MRYLFHIPVTIVSREGNPVYIKLPEKHFKFHTAMILALPHPLLVDQKQVDSVKQLNGKSYNKINELNGLRRYGLTAQEVEKIIPGGCLP